MGYIRMLRWASVLPLWAAAASAAVPVLSYTLGSPVTFATHAQLAGYGFQWGPSDGQFGAIPGIGNNYTFYGTAGSAASGAGTAGAKRVYTLTRRVEHVCG